MKKKILAVTIAAALIVSYLSLTSPPRTPRGTIAPD